MRGFTAIVIAGLALGACGGKKAAKDDCLGQKDEFLHDLKETLDGRASSSAPGDQARARAFFDGKYKYAEAHFDDYCRSVTDAEWGCIQQILKSGGVPSDACKPAADRMMKVVMNEDHPDY